MLVVSLLRPVSIRSFSVSSLACNLAQRPTDSATGSESHSELQGTTPDHATDHPAPSPPPSSSLPPSASNFDVHVVKSRLEDRFRQFKDHAALNFRSRTRDFTASAKITLSELGSQLNKVTGYEAIEDLKRKVAEQETCISTARQAAREAKVQYEEAVAQRSLSQREVNDLLQRKSNWSDHDVGRFTTLVRQDHLFEQTEVRAKTRVDETEDAVEREFSELMRTILARYHEEQVWSDKIRSASTYGSLAVLGLNMVVFVMAIVVVEPWKRRRLTQTFERKVEHLSLENEATMKAGVEQIGKQLVEQEKLIVTLVKGVSEVTQGAGPVPVQEFAREPESGVKTEKVDRTSSFNGLQQNHLELAVFGTGAFLAGIASCWLLGFGR